MKLKKLKELFSFNKKLKASLFFDFIFISFLETNYYC